MIFAWEKFFRNDYYKVDGEAAVVQNVDEDLDEITFKTLDGRIVSTTIDDDRIEQYEANDDEEYREMSLSYSDVILSLDPFVKNLHFCL